MTWGYVRERVHYPTKREVGKIIDSKVLLERLGKCHVIVPRRLCFPILLFLKLPFPRMSWFLFGVSAAQSHDNPLDWLPCACLNDAQGLTISPPKVFCRADFLWYQSSLTKIKSTHNRTFPFKDQEAACINCLGYKGWFRTYPSARWDWWDCTPDCLGAQLPVFGTW